MSRVMRAVRQAETERRSYVETLKQELREELRWMGSVMARWSPTGAPAPLPAGGSPEVGQTSITPPGPRNGGDADAPVASVPPAPVAPSWEQVTALVRQHLQRCEQQVMEEASVQVRLKAQAAELEQQALRVEQERAVTRQRLEHAAQAAAALEAARQALNVQVGAAQACQALARDLQAAVEEFQANAASVTQLVQGIPQPAGAAAYYQQLADALQRPVAQFTSRLSRAVTPQ